MRGVFGERALARRSVTRWAILTGEYPPQPGGVSDYTRLVACGLAEAGDSVTVFAPIFNDAEIDDPGVRVHRLAGFGPRTLRHLDRHLVGSKPDCILVQYVPHAFGYKAMNWPFAAWLAVRAGRIAPVWAMFHEVASPYSWPSPKHALLGAVTRLMARRIAGAAERVFVTIPAWGDLLKRLCPRMKPAEWSPVPCTFDADPSPESALSARRLFASHGEMLVGHFGTFGTLITDMLAPALVEMLRLRADANVLLIGRGSKEFRERFVGSDPVWNSRVTAVGELPADAISAHLRACDLLVQPFPDGISSRRTSAMAGLANGLPIATNLGVLSEPLWASGAVSSVPSPDPAALGRLAVSLLADRPAREALGRFGLALYRETFAIEHTIARLRGTA